MAGMLIIFAATISPTSLNGRFVVISKDASKLAVQLQVNTNTGTDDLGSATIVIGFDKTILNFSNSPANQTDYVFNNFNGGNYGTSKITKPKPDKIWINIYLPFANSNKGTIVSGSGNWTNVVTLYFDIIAPDDTIKLNWLNANTFWGVYDGDNKSLWTAGTLTDLQILPDAAIPLDVADVTTTNSKSVTVKFSKKVNPGTAKNKSNYTISNNVTINQVQLQPDSTSVLLKTSLQQSGIDYTLTVAGINDMYGKTMDPDPTTVHYKLPVKSKGGRVKTTISKVVASSWEGNYTPEKMIDGSIMEGSDSRWESAGFMPDTISYDLGGNVQVDSLRIAFYKGESGRIYKYSVLVSRDQNNWNTAVNDIWSDDSAWTELQFDSTSARYIKLILKASNQGKKASIWEFESYGLKKAGQTGDGNYPAQFTLMQNYPNPFNPSTKIRYNLPANNVTLSGNEGSMINVTLKVYDILGTEVTTLVNEEQTPGEHEVIFDAAGLASGVYIYRLQSENLIETKKMVLLR